MNPAAPEPASDGLRIGLEVHVYLATRAKLFCACPADFLQATDANRHVCATCTGQPGAKHMAPSRAALEAGVRVARALGCRTPPRARFLRKHYFYPDLPTNYQRTSEPLGTHGTLMGVRITELHVEEDPGTYDPQSGLVDYNRSGAPLLEIVTEPDLASPQHARAFLQELRLVLLHLGVLREEAGVKADCNVSLRGGERVEVKNVNSLRNVERALAHEVDRHRALLAHGEQVLRETRRFDEATGTTHRMRGKETAADYRFLDDPDLPPLDLAALATSLPPEESPLARRARLATLVGAPEEDVSPLLEERPLTDVFEEALRAAPPRRVFDWFVRDLRAELDWRGLRYAASGLTTLDVAKLVAALAEGRVMPQAATRLLREALDRGGAGLGAAVHAEASSGAPIDDEVGRAAREALAANPKAVADYKAGKTSAVNFLVGQAMRALKGRGRPDDVRAAVENALRDA